MNIAILATDIENPSPNVGDYFITESLRRSLAHHRILEFSLHRPPDAETVDRLRTQDALLIGGTNIVGISGTVIPQEAELVALRRLGYRDGYCRNVAANRYFTCRLFPMIWEARYFNTREPDEKRWLSGEYSVYDQAKSYIVTSLMEVDGCG